MKRLHPRFKDENDEREGKIIYSSQDDTTDEQHDIDPRWQQLKKLK